MTLFVDTSVWSLLLRRDTAPDAPEVNVLRRALEDGEMLWTTGIVIQELLQGRVPEPTRTRIANALEPVMLLYPHQDDHALAADIVNRCRSAGVQVGTVDALLAALCIGEELELLTADQDFRHLAKVVPLRLAA